MNEIAIEAKKACFGSMSALMGGDNLYGFFQRLTDIFLFGDFDASLHRNQ